MSQPNTDPVVRPATPADAGVVGRLLHDFNREFDEPTPDPEPLAQRVRELLGGGEMKILLIGEPPVGVSVMRFRPGLWSGALECYLAELYIVPAERGHGLGRRLMEATLDFARRQGADYMDLGTSEADVAARRLYESLGFDNREGKPDGPVSFYYERRL